MQVRLLTFDDLANVRYIQAAGYRRIVAGTFTDESMMMFERRIASPEYTDVLAASVRDARLFGCSLDGELIASGSWSPRGDSARLDGLFVRPLFTGLGVGRRLLDTVEASAYDTGYRQMALRCALNAVAFFLGRDYRMTSQGAFSPIGTSPIPVVFMRKDLVAAAPLCGDPPVPLDTPSSAA